MMANNNPMMEKAFIESKMMEQEMMHRQAMMNQQWDSQMEMEMANQWRANFIENEVLNSRENMMNKAFDEAKEEIELSKAAESKEATGGLISLMMTDPDPKFQNSKFLQFIKKVDRGEYEITDDNKLIVHPEKAGLDETNKDLLFNDIFDQSRAQERMESKSTFK